jgi:small-conductance mechanosensitive channel
MYASNWIVALQNSFSMTLAGVVSFIPNFVFAVVIFVIGWVLAWFVGNVIMQAVRAVKVDHALRSAGVDDIVSRAGYKLDSGAFLGSLVKWFIIVVFLMAALQILGLTAVTGFLQLVVISFLPNVIIAVLILLVTAVIAEVAQGVVAGSARAAGITAAGFAGAAARWAIWIFGIFMALDQLQVAQGIIQPLFLGVVVALSLAFGLSFGLGGQDAARDFIARVRSEIKRD